MAETRQHDRVRLQEAAAPIVAHFPGAIWLPFEARPKNNGKLDKIPALGCRTNDSASWFTLDAAIAAIEQYPALAGIGFAIPDGMITLDYDDCRDPTTGRLDFEAQSAVSQCGSYAYTTISGRGLRIVGLNNAKVPVRGGKYQMVTLTGQKIEVFVGLTNHFNTLAVDALTGSQQLADLSGFTSNLLGERLDERGEPRAPEDIDDLAARIPLQQVCDTLAKLPNPDGPEYGWEWWSRVAAAVHRCTGGSDEGLAAFDAWSAKSFRYCQGETPDERWASLTRSPMTAINYGSLIYWVRTTQGGDPGFRAPKRKRRPVGGFRFTAPKDMQLSDLPDFVEELLLEDSLAVIFGPPSAGKTFLIADLLLHVALGWTWFGREVDQGPTLLFALEGRRGVEQRILAFFRRYRLNRQDVPFRMTSDPIDLLDDAAVDNLITAIKAQGRELGAPVKAVAIDTLATALGGGDESTSETMGPVLINCHRIREQTGCCVLLIHHPGKDAGRGPRGFSGIVGTIDTLVEIQHPDKTKPARRVIIRKQRDLELGADFYYRLRPVEFSKVNRRGKPIISGVVVPITDPAEVAAAKAQTVKLTGHQQVGLDALRDVLQQQGAAPSRGRRATTQVAWREAFNARLPTDTLPRSARQAFKRMQQVLIRLKLVGTDETQVWLAEDIETEGDGAGGSVDRAAARADRQGDGTQFPCRSCATTGAARCEGHGGDRGALYQLAAAGVACRA